jgi:hypothetical protein
MQSLANSLWMGVTYSVLSLTVMMASLKDLMP